MSDLSYKPKFENGIIVADFKVNTNITNATRETSIANDRTSITSVRNITSDPRMSYYTWSTTIKTVANYEYNQMPLDYFPATATSLIAENPKYSTQHASVECMTSDGTSLSSLCSFDDSYQQAAVQTYVSHDSATASYARMFVYGGSQSIKSTIEAHPTYIQLNSANISFITSQLGIAGHVAKVLIGDGYNSTSSGTIATSIGSLKLFRARVSITAGSLYTGSTSFQEVKISANSSGYIQVTGTRVAPQNCKYIALNDADAGGLVLAVLTSVIG